MEWMDSISQICTGKAKFSPCLYLFWLFSLNSQFIHENFTVKLIECRILSKKDSSLNQARLYRGKICSLLTSLPGYWKIITTDIVSNKLYDFIVGKKNGTILYVSIDRIFQVQRCFDQFFVIRGRSKNASRNF